MRHEDSSTHLLAVKNQLGGLTFLDFTNENFVSAHGRLGAQVRQQVHKILRGRLDRLSAADFEGKVRQGRACHAILRKQAANTRLAAALRQALDEYLACLEVWSQGAQIVAFEHPHLAGCQVDGQPVGELDLALLLQHDSSGCQTGMYRQADGSVTLWHSEEDNSPPGERFDQLRIATFGLPQGGHNVRLSAFIYPDLLPGSAFAWRSDGYAQAVDTLLLKSQPALNSGTLANVASWVALRLGDQVGALEVLQALLPYWDGYALNVVTSGEGVVRASKYEFAADRLLQGHLDEQPGSYLFQVNIFSQRQDASLLALENLPQDERCSYEQRMARTQQALQRGQADGKDGSLGFFFNLLASRSGGEWAYANPDVKAYFVDRVSPDEMEIWLGPGPALRGEKPLVLESPTEEAV
ncbi:MAG: hypothetical protein AB1894_03730 [Chloroflexota bacterium]